MPTSTRQPEPTPGTRATARLAGLVLALSLSASTGCITSGRGGITPTQMPHAWSDAPRACKRPIDLTLLRREPLVEHVVRPGDLVGVHVEGIVSGQEISSGGSELPSFLLAPEGRESVVSSPAIGQPILVQVDGKLPIPLVLPVSVAGLSLQQAADAIRQAYIDEGILKDDPTKAYVQFSLIRQRPNQVLVVREDAPVTGPTLSRRDTYVIAQQGSGQIIELPADESDLLHALLSTGGLPGEDARSEVWILRGAAQGDWQAATAAVAGCEAGCPAPAGHHTVIPLRAACDTPLPFTRQDVVLNDGDVVFVEKRHEEVFYTGGLLSAGRIPLPRDEDIDIMEAVALANVGLGGPAGINASASLFRSGPGNVIPPTRATVIRKLPTGQQVKIDIDLRKTLKQPSERIRIMPEDFVSVHYRPHELVGNIALNFVNVNFVIPNGS